MYNDLVLAQTVRELDAFVAISGWDQPARLFAVVAQTELAAQQPELVLDNTTSEFAFIEQDLDFADADLVESLAKITWPDEVAGVALAVERLISLQPQDDADLTEETKVGEIRILAVVMRSGANINAIRQRAHDQDSDVAIATDLVPALNVALLQTLQN